MGTASSPLEVLEGYRQQCPNGWSSGPNDGYFYQNLARHLLASGRSDDLHQLLIASPDWMHASKQACQGYQNYAADLDLAISALKGRSSPGDVLVLVQLHTARQVVRHLASPDTSRSGVQLAGTDVWGPILAVLARAGHLAAMLELVDGLANDAFKAQALNESCRFLSEPGLKDVRNRLRNHAAGYALNIPHEGQRLSTLLEIAQPGMAQRLEPAIRQAGEPGWLRDLAIAYAKERQFDKALEVAGLISEQESEHGFALRFTIYLLAQDGQFERAVQIAQLVNDTLVRSRILPDLVSRLLSSGYTREAEPLVAELFSMDKDRVSIIDTIQVKILSYLAFERFRSGDIPQAEARLAQARQIVDNSPAYAQIGMLITLGTTLAQVQGDSEADRDFARADELLNSQSGQAVGGYAYNLVEALVTTARFDWAIQVAKAHPPYGDMIHLPHPCKIVADGLVDAGRFAEALAVLPLQTLAIWLGSLAEWAERFDVLEARLSLVVLREALRVVGWATPDWDSLYTQVRKLG